MDLLIVLGIAALLVRVGQTLYAVGLSRSKNAAGAATRSLFDLCLAVLAFWAVGAAILFQTRSDWIGIRPALLLGWGLSPESAATVFFYATCIPIATGVLVGTLAERSRFGPAALASILLAGILVPVVGKWAWTGWLARLGFIDLAGASAIHLSAGVCAAVGAVLVGARTGKYNRDGSASMIPGHNVPLAAAGSLLMIPGFLACALGFALINHANDAPLGRVALNLLLSAAAGGAAAVVLSRLRYGKIDATLAMLGLLGGLVAITAGAAHVSAPSAVIIGAIAGVLVPLASIVLDLMVRIDDPTGGVSVHAVAGLWGTLAAGLLAPASASAASLALRLKQAGVQLLGALAIAALAALASVVVFTLLKRMLAGGLRAREPDEFDGLDLAEHDLAAYPDFQQTMIKSYHLREA